MVFSLTNIAILWPRYVFLEMYWHCFYTMTIRGQTLYLWSYFLKNWHLTAIVFFKPSSKKLIAVNYSISKSTKSLGCLMVSYLYPPISQSFYWESTWKCQKGKIGLAVLKARFLNVPYNKIQIKKEEARGHLQSSTFTSTTAEGETIFLYNADKDYAG